MTAEATAEPLTEDEARELAALVDAFSHGIVLAGPQAARYHELAGRSARSTPAPGAATTEKPPAQRCPHCGRELRRLTARLGTREVFCGWEECGCDGAVAERARREAERRRRRDAQEAARLDRSCARAGLLPRYLRAEHPQAGRVADLLASGRNVWLWGDVGTGKTTLACAAARLLLSRGTLARYERVAALVGDLRAGDDRVPRLALAPALVLDDLGKEAASGWVAERLFALADERDGRELPTLVTSQYRPSELARRVGDLDTGKALVSRLTRGAEVVRLEGPDGRRG